MYTSSVMMALLSTTTTVAEARQQPKATHTKIQAGEETDKTSQWSKWVASSMHAA